MLWSLVQDVAVEGVDLVQVVVVAGGAPKKYVRNWGPNPNAKHRKLRYLK
jgi:hypothetical protein